MHAALERRLKLRRARPTVKQLETSDTNGVVATTHEEVDTSPVVVVRQILVVDDSAEARETLRAALEPLERPIAMAASGPEAARSRSRAA